MLRCPQVKPDNNKKKYNNAMVKMPFDPMYQNLNFKVLCFWEWNNENTSCCKLKGFFIFVMRINKLFYYVFIYKI